MASLLHARKLAKSFGSDLLFENLELVIEEGERLGLIGPNGAGKSTLLKILAGLEAPEEGEVISRKGLKLAYVPQMESFAPGFTVYESVAESARDAGIPDVDAAVSIMLGKVGLPDPTVEACTLSGGGRKRLTIARGLVREPDILLLDEPTNHLDIAGFLWLEQILGNPGFAWVMVSHDRRFLERTTTRVAELDPVYPDQWLEVQGNYQDFLRRKSEYLESLSKYKETLDNKVRRETEWLQRQPKARTTKSKSRVDGAYDLIDELSKVRGSLRKTETRIEFSASGRKTRKLVEMKGINKKMGERNIVSDLELLLSPGSRLGLLGANGSGKTTLLRMIAGNLEPDKGSIKLAPDLNVVYFDQNRAQLDQNQTLQRALCETGDNVIYQGRPTHIISWAKRFRFTPDQLPSPVSTLSGGEQARLMIARLMLLTADVLILDEPTNDLDIPTLEVLESSLDDFPGALVLVTHDRFMIDRICTSFVGLDGNGGWGHFADYQQWENALSGPVPEKARKSGGGKKVKTGPKRLSYKDQRELDGMEETIMEAEEHLDNCRAATEDPKIASSAEKSLEAFQAFQDAQVRVDHLYQRWAELEALLQDLDL